MIAAVIWVAEGLGGILTGSGTDPNSGPLLALFALAYWPTARPLPRSSRKLNSDETNMTLPARQPATR